MASQLMARLRGSHSGASSEANDIAGQPELLAGFTMRFAKALLERDAISMTFILGGDIAHQEARAMFAEATGVQLSGPEVDQESLLYDWGGITPEHKRLIFARRAMAEALEAVAMANDDPDYCRVTGKSIFEDGATDIDSTPGKESIANPATGKCYRFDMFSSAVFAGVQAVLAVHQAEQAYRVAKAKAMFEGCRSRAQHAAQETDWHFL